MALIKCTECGKEISDKAAACPNCGAPNNCSQQLQNKILTQQEKISDSKQKKKEKKKDSKLSIVAAILALFTFTAWIGLIVAIIDLIKSKSNKGAERHIGSYFAIICAVIMILISLGNSESEKQSENVPAQQTSDETIQSNMTIDENENVNEDEIESSVAQTEEETKEPETEVMSEEDYKALCQEYNYKDVLRNPENYVGEKVKITLKISSVHEAGITNPTKYYFAYSESDYGWYGDRYAVYDKRTEQDPKLLSDDIITIWGEIADPAQTSSFIVNSEELFVIDMKYAELIAE